MNKPIFPINHVKDNKLEKVEEKTETLEEKVDTPVPQTSTNVTYGKKPRFFNVYTASSIATNIAFMQTHLHYSEGGIIPPYVFNKMDLSEVSGALLLLGSVPLGAVGLSKFFFELDKYQGKPKEYGWIVTGIIGSTLLNVLLAGGNLLGYEIVNGIYNMVTK